MSNITHHIELPEGIGLSFGDSRIELELEATEELMFPVDSKVELELEVSKRPDLLQIPNSSIREMIAGGLWAQIGFDLRVEYFAETQVDAEILARLSFVLCNEEGSLLPQTVQIPLPIRLLQEGQRELHFSLPMAEPISGEKV